MNTFSAQVEAIESMPNLTIVRFSMQGDTLCMTSLELNTPISVGSNVTLATKASSVLLAKDFEGLISASNQLECQVQSIEHGRLLSCITLGINEHSFESIITTASCLKMNIQEGDNVTALIKSSELSIIEVDA